MESEANTHGARRRAFDLDRTISLSDGIFAFALTLLVLSPSAPEIASNSSSAELWTALKQRDNELISYLVSFCVVGGFWIRHHRFCGTLEAVDGRFLVINLAYLATIAFTPYPTQLLGDFGNSAAFAFYAVALSASTIAGGVLSEYAARAGLLREARTDEEKRKALFNGIAVTCGFLVSIPIVLLSDQLWLGYLCWFTGASLHRLVRPSGSGKH